jgi:hypothetical protein
MSDIVSVSASVNLDELAANIRSCHAATLVAVGSAVEHAMAAGDELLKAKAQIKHGEWLSWLEQECDLGERHAERYMLLARNRDKLTEIRHTVSDLSLRGALRRLASPKPATESKPPKKAQKLQPARDDIGPDSAGEVARLRARVDELANDKRRLEIENTGLRSEIQESKSAPLTYPTDNASRAALEKISRLLGEARALATHLAQNRDAVLGKMQSAKTAADAALETGLTSDPKKEGIPLFLQTQNRSLMRAAPSNE